MISIIYAAASQIVWWDYHAVRQWSRKKSPFSSGSEMVLARFDLCRPAQGWSSVGSTLFVHGHLRVCSTTGNYVEHHYHRATETSKLACFRLPASVFVLSNNDEIACSVPFTYFRLYPVLSYYTVLKRGATAHLATTPRRCSVWFICTDENRNSAMKTELLQRRMHFSTFHTYVHADLVSNEAPQLAVFATNKQTRNKEVTHT